MLLTKIVDDYLQANSETFNNISRQLWERPELMYEEHFAHQLITNFLEERGFQVERSYCKVPTAFRAEYKFGKSSSETERVPTVAVLCEYDALPEIGHACGHNLIAEAGIAAACAAMNSIRTAVLSDPTFPAGKIVVLGCPAEEGGGGKIDLINAGAFKDIDFAMMIHPHSDDVLYTVTLGLERCSVHFYGKASHPTVGPLEGISALDAAIAAYSNVSQARQHMLPEWRVHGIISNGGVNADIVPEYTLSQYYVRCPKLKHLPVMKQQLQLCFEAAAKSTGCRVDVAWFPRVFLPLDTNRAMANIFGKYSMEDGVVYGPDPGLIGSSDIGNVSVEIPTIHPKVYVGEKTLIHTRDFQKLAGSPVAQYYILRAAKAMAMTCIELMHNPQLRAEAKKEFEMTHNDYC